MDMHHVGQFADGGVFAHQHADLLNDISTVGTIGMTAKYQAIGADKKLEQTLSLAHGKSLAVSTPERFAALVGDTLRLQLILRRTYAGGLRRGKDGGGHDIETDAVVLTQDMVHSPHGLHLCGMSEHLTAIHITNGVDMG